MNKDYAHNIVSLDDLKFVERDKKFSQHVISPDCQVRLLRINKNDCLEAHKHPYPMEKILLKGKLVYENDQEFLPGYKAHLTEGKTYDLAATEDSILMLIEPRLANQVKKASIKNKAEYRWSQFLTEIGRSWKLYLIVLVVFMVSIYAALEFSPDRSSSFSNIGIGLASSILIFFLFDYSFKNHRERNAKVWQRFSLANFIQEIAFAQNKIRIYSTYSNLFINEEKWKEFKGAVLDRYRSEHAKSLVIQVLLLDPDSYAAKQRDKERNSENVIQRINENIENLHKWINYIENKQHLSEFMQVRITDSLPRHQHHQIDDTINFGFYPQNMPASEGSYLRCSAWTEIGKFATQSFEEIWADRSVTINLDEYIKKKSQNR